MTNYKKGVRLEQEVIDIFKEHGWDALRSAGSHSPFDVVLVKYTDPPKQFKIQGNKKICFVAFVQCKVKRLKKEDTPEQSPPQSSLQQSQ